MSAADLWEDVGDAVTACPICGRESCEEHLPPEDREAATSQRKPRLIVHRALDVMAAPQPAEIVEGIAWEGCITVLVSESGIGKTFVVLDLEATVSAGIAWHGRTTRQGSVVHFGFEGDALGLRLRALHDVTGHRLEHVYIVRGTDPLSPLIDRDRIEQPSIGELMATAALRRLAEELGTAQRPPIVLLVIDTVRASLAGSEDNSGDVSAYLRAVRRLLAIVPGAAAVLVHHAGWQDGEQQRKRERGSSAWRGNCDGTIYVEAGEYDARQGKAELTLRALKVRDAERPAPLHLIRRRVELAEMDRRGQPVTSCVIERDRRTREDREAEALEATKAAHWKVDLAVLRAMRDCPGTTSQRALSTYLGMRHAAVVEAIGRLLRAGLATHATRQPFVVTEAGSRALVTS